MEYYSAKRYNNWINQIRETDVDLDDPNSLLVFDQMMEDFVVACTKLINAVREREINKKQALEELEEMRKLLMLSVDFEDTFKNDFFEFAREGLKVVSQSVRMYLEGKKTKKDFENLLQEAVKKERNGDLEGAFTAVARMGTKVLQGGKLPEDMDLPEDGYVLNWLDGLDALNTVMVLTEIDAPAEENEDE